MWQPVRSHLHERDSRFSLKRFCVFLLLLGIFIYLLHAINIPFPSCTIARKASEFSQHDEHHQVDFKNFQIKFEFVRLPTNFLSRCNFENSQANDTLLIIILSAPGKGAVREAIRRTWANTTIINNRTHSVETFFLIGNGKDFNQNVADEADIYDDIILTDVPESYKNLVYKTSIMLRIASEMCGGATFVLKVDEDVVFHIDRFFGQVGEQFNSNEAAIYGSIWHGKKPLRDPRSKWFISKDHYNGTIYPDFMSGSSYIMTMKAVQMLYEALPKFPLIYVEDVLVTGLIAQSVGVPRIDPKSFLKWQREKPKCGSALISIHDVKGATNLEKTWNYMNKAC